MERRWAQFGIAVGALGGVLTLIGFFPGLTGFVEFAPGIGIIQILTILTGFILLFFGAYVFVQSVFYPNQKHNLAQQIGLRLSLTGLLVAAAAGLADVLGYGSNPPTPDQRPILGPYQAVGLIGGFIVASIGVLIFALMGTHIEPPDEPPQP